MKFFRSKLFRGPFGFLLLLFLLGLILRTAFGGSLENRTYFGDARDYLLCAKNVAEGKGFNVLPDRNAHAHVAPAYPIFLLFSMIPSGDNLYTIRILQALLSSLTVFPAFLLMKTLETFRAGYWAAGIVAIYPFYIYWAGMIATETLCIFLIAWAFFFFFKAVKEAHLKWWVLPGVFLGLASLTRSSNLGLTAVFLGAIILMEQWNIKSFLRKGGVFLLAFFLTLAPYLIRNYSLFGHFVPVTLGSHMLYYQAVKTLDIPPEEKSTMVENMLQKYYKNPTSPQDEYNGHRILRDEAFKIYRLHPSALIPTWKRNFLRFWSFYPTQFAETPNPFYKAIGLLSYGLLFPFFLIGMYLGIRKFKKYFLFFGSLSYFTLVHVVFMGMIRYRLPVEIIIIGFAAITISKIQTSLGFWRGKKYAF